MKGKNSWVNLSLSAWCYPEHWAPDMNKIQLVFNILAIKQSADSLICVLESLKVLCLHRWIFKIRTEKDSTD